MYPVRAGALAYSPCNAMTQRLSLTHPQKKHYWVFAMMEAAPDSGMDYDVADALPEATPEAQKKAVQDVKAWLKSLPLSRRPLCKVALFGHDMFCQGNVLGLHNVPSNGH